MTALEDWERIRAQLEDAAKAIHEALEGGQPPSEDARVVALLEIADELRRRFFAEHRMGRATPPLPQSPRKSP